MNRNCVVLPCMLSTCSANLQMLSLCCDARRSSASVVAAAASELMLIYLLFGCRLLLRVKPPLLSCMLFVVVTLLSVLRYHEKFAVGPSVESNCVGHALFSLYLEIQLKGPG